MSVKYKRNDNKKKGEKGKIIELAHHRIILFIS